MSLRLMDVEDHVSSSSYADPTSSFVQGDGGSRGRSGRGSRGRCRGVGPSSRGRIRAVARGARSYGRARAGDEFIDRESAAGGCDDRRQSKGRNYCFTLNNPEEGVEEYIQSIECRYMVYGREVGESGTPHLQGLICFDNQRSFGGVLSLFLPYHPHVEKIRGTVDQNDAYCKKDGDIWCKGDKPLSAKEKGKMEKERWTVALTAAKEGRLDDIDDDIRFKHYNTCKNIMKDHLVMPADVDGKTGLWIYGLSGCGKSRYARYTYPGAYLKMANKWWDGYQAQEFVIIEDLDPRHNMLGHHLKLWTDRYSFLAETKGSAFAIRPKKIIITSQYPISQVFDDVLTVDALTRRCDILHITEAWAPPDEEAIPIPDAVVIPHIHIE